MSSIRLKRLQADFNQITQYVHRHPRLQLIQAVGDPPERYQLEYRVKSLRQKDGELHEVDSHLVEITLLAGYPRMAPLCRMLTPVFHPNIAPHAICIGDHWSAGESLANLVARMGEMLAYQSYNTKSPLNGEASRWTEQNIARLPLDSVNMNVDLDPATVPTAPPTSPRVVITAPPPPPPRPAPAAPPAAVRLSSPPPATELPATPPVIACPSCAAQMRFQPALAGKKLRCPRCKTVFQAPTFLA